MMKPQTVTDADLAFGGDIERLIPAYESIPDEFKDRDTKWNQLFSHWFYKGLKSATFTPKEGIDKQQALRHIRAVMGSFEPKHEHKEAAVTYLLSLWFEDVVYS